MFCENKVQFPRSTKKLARRLPHYDIFDRLNCAKNIKVQLYMVILFAIL